MHFYGLSVSLGDNLKYLICTKALKDVLFLSIRRKMSLWNFERLILRTCFIDECTIQSSTMAMVANLSPRGP